MSNSIVRLALDGLGGVDAAGGPARQLPQHPRVDRAEGQVGPGLDAALGEQPLELGARRSTGRAPARSSGGPGRRWPAAAQLRRSGRRCAGPARRAPGAGAGRCARSHTTVVSRWLVMPIAATGSPSRRAMSSASVCLGGGPDVVGVVLDQAGGGEVLRELAVGVAGRRAVGAHGEAAHPGRPGVDGDHHGHRADASVLADRLAGDRRAARATAPIRYANGARAPAVHR